MFQPNGFPTFDNRAIQYEKFYPKERYENFLDFCKPLFGADCTAFVVKQEDKESHEIIWSYFNEHLITFNDLISQDIRRKELIKNPHTLFVHFLTRKTPINFNIYMMGGSDNKFLQIYFGKYNPKRQEFSIAMQ